MGLSTRGCSGRLGLADAHCRGMVGVDLHLERLLRLRGESILAKFISFHAYFYGRDEFEAHCVDARGSGYRTCTASKVVCGCKYY